MDAIMAQFFGRDVNPIPEAKIGPSSKRLACGPWFPPKPSSPNANSPDITQRTHLPVVEGDERTWRRGRKWQRRMARRKPRKIMCLLQHTHNKSTYTVI